MATLLLRHIDRVIILIGLLALVALGARTLHNVATLASEAFVQQELRRDFGDITVAYALNAGNNKPVFFNRHGDALVEYSAWSSFITVDGITLDLWSHAFNIYSDKQTGRLHLTMSSVAPGSRRGGPEPKNYQIEQQVEVTGNTATIKYFIIPNEPVRTVRLLLGHYGWYLQRPRLDGGTATFERANLTRETSERGGAPSRYTSVSVRFGLHGTVELLRNQYGSYALNVTYFVENPPPFVKTLIAAETILAGSAR